MRLRHIALAALAVACFVLPTSARERFFGYCEQGGQRVSVNAVLSTTRVQQSYPSCTITVYAAGTLNLATIFSDNAGTALANPFTASSTGLFVFYANDGRYDVRLSTGGIPTPFTWGDIQLSDGLGSFIIEAVTFSATPTFDASDANLFQMTLTGNVTSSTVSNASSGKLIAFQLCQDSTGGRTFAWPATFLRPPEITSVASACTNATFYYDGTNWRPLAATTDNSVAVGADIRLERVSANVARFATGDALALDTLQLDAANRDFSLTRGAANRADTGAGDSIQIGSGGALLFTTTGDDVGSATVRPDVFVENARFGNDALAGNNVNVTQMASFNLMFRNTGTNQVTYVGASPNGTIADGTAKALFRVFGTDIVADGSNFENADIEAETQPESSNRVALTSIVRAANVVTVTTTTAHTAIATDSITIAGSTDGGTGTSFNGTFTVATAPTATTLTFAQVGANGTAGIGGATFGIPRPVYYFKTRQLGTGRHRPIVTQVGGFNLLYLDPETGSITTAPHLLTAGVAITDGATRGDLIIRSGSALRGIPDPATTTVKTLELLGTDNRLALGTSATPIVLGGHSVTTGAGGGDIIVLNARGYRTLNAAGNNTYSLIQASASDGIALPFNTTVGNGTTAPRNRLDVYTEATNSGISLQAGSAFDSPAYILRDDSGTIKTYFGVADATNDWVTGSADGDTVIRTTSQKLLITTDAGSTVASQWATTGVLTTNKGINIGTSVAAGGTGFKHGRVTTGSCATTGCQITLTWAGSAFADTNYTANCSVEDSTAQSETTGLRFAKISSRTTTTIVVDIDNFSGAGVTGTVHCSAYHD